MVAIRGDALACLMLKVLVAFGRFELDCWLFYLCNLAVAGRSLSVDKNLPSRNLAETIGVAFTTGFGRAVKLFILLTGEPLFGCLEFGLPRRADAGPSSGFFAVVLATLAKFPGRVVAGYWGSVRRLDVGLL